MTWDRWNFLEYSARIAKSGLLLTSLAFVLILSVWLFMTLLEKKLQISLSTNANLQRFSAHQTKLCSSLNQRQMGIFQHWKIWFWWTLVKLKIFQKRKMLDFGFISLKAWSTQEWSASRSQKILIKTQFSQYATLAVQQEILKAWCFLTWTCFVLEQDYIISDWKSLRKIPT